MNNSTGRIFQIISNDDTFQFVEENDINDLTCVCKGKLKVDREYNKGFQRNVRLKCDECTGVYIGMTHTPTNSVSIRVILKALNYDADKINQYFHDMDKE
jgi:hypothetical protein